MKNHTDELVAFLEEYTRAHQFSFLREDPRTFASRLSMIFSAFFLGDEKNYSVEGLKEKALYCLWNNIIDDSIEYTDRGKESVLDSLEALLESRKRKNFKPRTEPGQIIYDFAQRFHHNLSGPNKKISEELMYLDLVRILNGFDYERIVHENDTIGTLSEYMEFGAVTADLRVFLDIDIAVFPHGISLSTIGDLREAYRWFDMAIKISSDIATFEREYFTELSQNSVILYGQEKELLPRDVLKAEKTYKERLFQDVIPLLMKEVENEGRTYLHRSLTYLHKITEVDTSNLSEAFRTMFEKYPGQREFSAPHAK